MSASTAPEGRRPGASPAYRASLSSHTSIEPDGSSVGRVGRQRRSSSPFGVQFFHFERRLLNAPYCSDTFQTQKA